MADGPEEAGLSQDAAETDRRRAALEAGRRLFARECRFVAGTTTVEALPPASLPEIAFAGRSNVGKSSLINALTGHRALARVSHTPGRTQQINFFDLGGRLMLVDLPGYGFAAVGRRQSGAWTRLIALYLLLVSPSVYEWYLLWLLALVTLTQTWSLPAWLYWSWSINLDYLELYWRWSVNRHYLETLALNWLRIAEYGPLFLWLAGRWL